MRLLALLLLLVASYGVSAQKTMARGGKGGGEKCSTPSGLSTSSITISSATANWSPVSGANSYNVDYKQSSSSSWINIASGTTSLSWNLSGLPASTSFDWRVRTNCSSGSSGYAQKTFSTLSQSGVDHVMLQLVFQLPPLRLRLLLLPGHLLVGRQVIISTINLQVLPTG